MRHKSALIEGQVPQVENHPRRNNVDLTRPGLVYGAAFTVVLGGLQLPSDAKFWCEQLKPDQEFAFSIQRKETEQIHSFKFIAPNEVTDGSRAPKEITPLFQDLSKIEINLNGVNYSVKDQDAFDSFLIKGAHDAKQHFGLSWSSMESMSPRDLVETSGWLTGKMQVEPRIIRPREDYKNPDYSDELRREINARPIDVMLSLGLGVCRQFSAGFAVIANRLKTISHSHKLDYIHVGSLHSRSDVHALDVIFELTEDGGSPKILTSFVDMSIPISKLKREGVNIASADALKTKTAKIKPTFDAYLKPLISNTDRRDFMKCLVRYNEQGSLNLSLVGSIINLYLEDAVDLWQKHDKQGYDKLFSEERSYYSEILPLVEASVLQGHKTDTPNQIFGLEILSRMYKRLGRDSDRNNVEKMILELKKQGTESVRKINTINP